MTYHQLTQEERYLISGGVRLKRSQRELAKLLGRSPSTISRELRRNATAHDGLYRAAKAHSYVLARRCGARITRIARRDRLATQLDLLSAKTSP